jgi:hypothetical protein
MKNLLNSFNCLIFVLLFSFTAQSQVPVHPTIGDTNPLQEVKPLILPSVTFLVDDLQVDSLNVWYSRTQYDMEFCGVNSRPYSYVVYEDGFESEGFIITQFSIYRNPANLVEYKDLVYFGKVPASNLHFSNPAQIEVNKNLNNIIQNTNQLLFYVKYDCNCN